MTCTTVIPDACGTQPKKDLGDCAPKPYNHVCFNPTVKWPRGSVVSVGQCEFVNPQVESRSPSDCHSSWRPYKSADINLKLQRLGECSADFIFPPILGSTDSTVCDEPSQAQAWKRGMVGTYKGALWTPASDKDVVFSTPGDTPSDWCGPHQPQAVISKIMHMMCG